MIHVIFDMKNKILSFLSIIFLAVPVFAEKITWEEIVKQPEEKSPAILSAKLQLDNAQLSYKRSLSGYMPSISASGSASQGEKDKNFSRSYSYGLNANLSIFSGFNTYNEVKIRSAELKAAELTYKRAVSDAAYEAAVQYTNLMWAYETVELLEQIKARRAENKDMINLKYNSGNVDIGSLRRVAADVELASYELRKAQRYIETASASLLKVIGRNDDIILETDERITLEDRSLEKPQYNALVESIPEFLISQYSIDIYKAQSSKSKSTLLPEVKLSGSLSRYGNEWAPGKNGWDAGLSISYPLFTGGTRYADIETASNLYKAANENFRTITYQLKSQAVAYYNSLTDAYENISTRELYLAASKLQAEISQRKYVNGLSTYQDWYSIENDYISSRKTMLDAKKTAALERAKWYNFIGEGFIRPGK